MQPTLVVILSAIVFSVLIPIIHVVIIKIFIQHRRDILYMFTTFLIYALIVIYYDHSNGYNSIICITTSLSSIVFLCLLYAEFFSMVCRGFSLNVIVDIYLGKKVTLEQLVNGYAGKGIDWMLLKRLDSLKSLGLISVVDNEVKLISKKAVVIGKIGLLFKKILNLPAGG